MIDLPDYISTKDLKEVFGIKNTVTLVKFLKKASIPILKLTVKKWVVELEHVRTFIRKSNDSMN
jgi:hypothetical protein